jgi:nucleotide-binding universal stress UspA family protein
MTEQRIVIGYDGSPGAERALSWALAEAARTHAEVELTYAWMWPTVLTVTSAGALVILPPVADRFFPGTVGIALALLTAGLSLVGAAILAARRSASRRADGNRGRRPGARPDGPATGSGGVRRRGEE